MRTRRDELEDRLAAMLRRQADALPVAERRWTEVGTAPAGAGPMRRRAPLLAGLAVAAACSVVAVSLVAQDDAPQQVRTGPAAREAGEEGTRPPEATTTTAVPATGGAVKAETRQVLFTADAVTIDAGGRRFVTAQPLSAHSDPGNSEYTTLELSWQEHGVEMRLYVYFDSDGREWWSKEIRTYDGSAQGEWITYTGDFFRSPLGSPFTGDFTVATPDPAVGRLHLANARIQAFRPAPECTEGTTPMVLAPGTSPIVLSGHSNGYGVGVTLLDRDTCTPVPDQGRYAYDWTTSNAAVVSIVQLPIPNLPPGRGFLARVGAGRAVVHVTARDPATAAVVAEVDIEVVVGDGPGSAPPPTVTGPGAPPPAIAGPSAP